MLGQKPVEEDTFSGRQLTFTNPLTLSRHFSHLTVVSPAQRCSLARGVLCPVA